METTDTRLLSSVEETEHRGWYDADHLPHFDVPGLVQHVTYHLADSLPKTAIRHMEESLDTLPTKQRKLKRRQRIQELLDSGLGSCILKRDDCAKIVESSFFFGHGSRYQLLAWVVMPNHVHVLIEQMEGWPLGKIVQSWKRHTAREINRIRFSSNDTRPSRASSTTRPSQVWQRNYWDRYIRDEDHLEAAIRYIEWNPVKARFVDRPEDWLWSSAQRRATL